MITREEVLMGREREFPLTQELEANLEKLLKALNKFREIYAKPMIVNSGYRPGYYNEEADGAKKSTHMLCLACDFRDLDGKLDYFCTQNKKVLAECGLWLEHPKWTKNWCHLQAVPPKSGSRIYIPKKTEPLPQHFDIAFKNL